jgi:hypothetical protein
METDDDDAVWDVAERIRAGKASDVFALIDGVFLHMLGEGEEGMALFKDFEKDFEASGDAAALEEYRKRYWPIVEGGLDAERPERKFL